MSTLRSITLEATPDKPGRSQRGAKVYADMLEDVPHFAIKYPIRNPFPHTS